MSQGQRRLAAIMFTDMVGYTALSQKNESLAMNLLEEHRNLVRPFFAKHDGKEIKTMGDAFLVEFVSALEAVRCAFDIQQSLHETNLGRLGDYKVQVRIGVHLGDVIHSQNDVYGDAVNIASRIEPLAEPGGISITEQVHDQIRNKFEFPFRSLGRKDLKNVGEKTEIFRVVMPWEKNGSFGPSLDPHRVAVLPFVNMSPDPQDEFFADGLTEELIDRLCHVGGLEVIARTSVMSFKKKDVKAADIGKELRAGALVEGSIRKAGKRIRVTAQLIDANTEGHLWSSKYDRDMEDIFAVQTDIAEQVAVALEIKLLPEEKKIIAQNRTRSIDAYTLYLKGRQAWNHRSREAVEEALSCFKRALEIDPSFALAYVGMSDCYGVMESWGYGSSAEVAPAAKQSILRALQLDGNLAEAHTSYAAILASNEWNWQEAEIEFNRALELNPNYATAHQWFAHSVLRFTGRTDEEMREVDRALELDPLAPVMYLNKGQSLFVQERYEEAVEWLEKAQSIEPGLHFARLLQGLWYLSMGRHADGIMLIENSLPKIGFSDNRKKIFLVYAYGKVGREAEARKLLEEVTASPDMSTSPTEFAYAHFALGQIDEVFKFLDLAFVQRDSGLQWLLINPDCKSLRSDARFQELQRKVGVKLPSSPHAPFGRVHK